LLYNYTALVKSTLYDVLLADHEHERPALIARAVELLVVQQLLRLSGTPRMKVRNKQAGPGGLSFPLSLSYRADVVDLDRVATLRKPLVVALLQHLLREALQKRREINA
jgi:hypothetical protein